MTVLTGAGVGNGRIVPRYKLILLRVLYALMAVFLGFDAWGHLMTFDGEWDPAGAAAWSVWASYSILALAGLLHPLRMLPLVMLEILYKSIWLVIVALPLAVSGDLPGSAAEEMTYAFLWVILPIAAMPWRYAVDHYVRPSRRTPAVGAPRAADAPMS